LAEILNNIKALLPFFAGSWLLFILCTLWKPQKFRNSVFLMAALAGTVLFISGLFGEQSGNALIVLALLILLAILLVPAMLIVNGIYMMKREARSLGNLLSLLAGIVIGLGEVAMLLTVFISSGVIREPRHFGWAIFAGTTVLYFSLWILTIVLYILFIQWMPHRYDFSAVIIHGSGLIRGDRIGRLLGNRLDKAIAIYRKCKKKPILIPSGGQGENETVSEAIAMKQYLIDHGIPQEHILMEAISTTTKENLRYSKELLAAYGLNGRIALVSSNYHIYRCLQYAHKMKLKCVGFGAKVAWYYFPSATLREFIALFTRPPHVIWMGLGYVFMIVIPAVYLLLA